MSEHSDSSVPTANILVILNPSAGQSDAGVTVTMIENTLSQSNSRFEIRKTRGEGDAAEWARTALGFDRVLVAGGDGTVIEALSGMIKNPLPLPIVILPLGTANLLARSLAIPTDLGEALELAIKDGVVVSMDVGYLPDHDRYFAIVAGSGWDAQLIADATRELKNRLGFFAYVLTGFKNLFSLRSSNVRVTIDGKMHRFRAHTVMVLNVGEIYGTTIALGENVSPHDGKLDLVVASTHSLWGVLKVVYRLLTKQFHGAPELRYFPATHFRFEADPPLKLEIDGDCIGETPFEVTVVPAGARLVVPREYAEAKQLEMSPL